MSGRGARANPRGAGASRGGASGSRGRGGASSTGRVERAPILDLAKYVDKEVRVKFTGGREVTGVLKGFDQLLNLVMDDVRETLADANSLAAPSVEGGKRRALGLTVIRGTALVVISPVDGSRAIPNPFLEAGDA